MASAYFLFSWEINGIIFLQRYLRSGDAFYLHSDPDYAGSPPHRVPPPITRNQRDFVESCKSQWSSYQDSERSPMFSQKDKTGGQLTAAPDKNSLHNASILSLGLPILKTGMHMIPPPPPPHTHTTHVD